MQSGRKTQRNKANESHNEHGKTVVEVRLRPKVGISEQQ